MIKFLHTADLHLDSPFAALRPEQAIQRRQEQRALVGKICAVCRENACDLLLLPGDLFDGGGVYLDTLDVLRDELCECGAQVFIAPGNHDFLTPASPYLTQACRAASSGARASRPPPCPVCWGASGCRRNIKIM